MGFERAVIPSGNCPIDDAPADLVPEGERKRRVGTNATIEVAEVGVAKTAGRNLEQDLSRMGGRAMGWNSNHG